MKSYDELKAEMDAIQQQMVEAKKNERANALKEVKGLCKEFGISTGTLKGALVKGKERIMKPVFVLGLGAQKAGTSWLHRTLSKNDNVNLGFEKEYHVWDYVFSDLCANFKAKVKKT